jgi:hypothetical protein
MWVVESWRVQCSVCCTKDKQSLTYCALESVQELGDVSCIVPDGCFMPGMQRSGLCMSFGAGSVRSGHRVLRGRLPPVVCALAVVK